MPVEFRDLDPNDEPLLQRLTQLSFDAAALHAPNWLPTLDDARQELDDALRDGKISRCLFERGIPVAWGSITPLYGKVWEIHPLLVHVEHHRRGFGKLVVRDLEAHASRKGAGVLFVSTSDETDSTSLGGRDLFIDPIGALATIEHRRSAALQFWTRMGYEIVGLIPDAEGVGKPSIHLAKRPPQ